MTKQELIKMTGSEEQAAYAMEILLRNCKKDFVRLAIQAELNKIESQIDLQRRGNHLRSKPFQPCKLGKSPGGFRERAWRLLARNR